MAVSMASGSGCVPMDCASNVVGMVTPDPPGKTTAFGAVKTAEDRCAVNAMPLNDKVFGASPITLPINIPVDKDATALVAAALILAACAAVTGAADDCDAPAPAAAPDVAPMLFATMLNTLLATTLLRGTVADATNDAMTLLAIDAACADTADDTSDGTLTICATVDMKEDAADADKGAPALELASRPDDTAANRLARMSARWATAALESAPPASAAADKMDVMQFTAWAMALRLPDWRAEETKVEVVLAKPVTAAAEATSGAVTLADKRSDTLAPKASAIVT